MFRVHVEKSAGAAGLAFVVLFIAGIVAGGIGAAGFTGVGMVPANPQESVAVLRANTAVLGLSIYLISLAALALVCFTSGLASALRRSQRNDGAHWMLAQAGGLLYAAYLLIYVSLQSQAVFMAQTGGSGTTAVDVLVRLPFDQIFWSFNWIPEILLVGGVGLSAMGSELLPRWIAVSSLSLAGAMLILAGIGLVTLFPLAWLGFPIFLLIWVPMTSILLLRRGSSLAGSTVDSREVASPGGKP